MELDEFGPIPAEALATLEEQVRTREEMIAAARRKVAMEALLRADGWKYLESYWLQRIESARQSMLAIDTSDEAKSMDALRNWRALERQWAEWVSYVNDCLSMDGAEEILIKEQVNG